MHPKAAHLCEEEEEEEEEEVWRAAAAGPGACRQRCEAHASPKCRDFVAWWIDAVSSALRNLWDEACE